jgi:hypothetical protein
VKIISIVRCAFVMAAGTVVLSGCVAAALGAGAAGGYDLKKNYTVKVTKNKKGTKKVTKQDKKKSEKKSVKKVAVVKPVKAKKKASTVTENSTELQPDASS